MEPEPPITYISQHYTHSSHIAPRWTQPVIHLDQAGLADVLHRHSIDPHSLLPQQINLFQNADDEQRLRLLELWRISPPTDVSMNGTGDYAGVQSTRINDEEEMARLRYEGYPKPGQLTDRKTSETRNGPAPDIDLIDGQGQGHHHAEPYMISGYDYLASRDYDNQTQSMLQETTKYNQATDPVYKGPGRDMHKGCVEDMENRWSFNQMKETEVYHAQDQDLDMM
ncbi:hypothetical protein P152DRAFT_389807 [Eremomyces bilateralis CBS 781.70]|uniref:Uncharacterized protein n=1 Tax=Eremomyces bilateralis CBS 781.70 TaxID=1392243 RepID=A0A6G1GDK5_9PEZI|nr:uncharacterized protein P152DRAFT_389807 [Eremomyces bilateralis CBS 781.70]KAF1815996.1 hypothetical protein P152DRAFT_389807 [Eremomyces bilateralis CBS 781.70]